MRWSASLSLVDSGRATHTFCGVRARYTNVPSPLRQHRRTQKCTCTILHATIQYPKLVEGIQSLGEESTISFLKMFTSNMDTLWRSLLTQRDKLWGNLSGRQESRSQVWSDSATASAAHLTNDRTPVQTDHGHSQELIWTGEASLYLTTCDEATPQQTRLHRFTVLPHRWGSPCQFHTRVSGVAACIQTCLSILCKVEHYLVDHVLTYIVLQTQLCTWFFLKNVAEET